MFLNNFILGQVKVKVGGFKFAKDQHRIRDNSDVDSPGPNMPLPRNEFQSDKFQAAFIMYCFLMKRDIRGGLFVPSFDDDEFFSWKELHLAHLIKCIFSNPESSIHDILSHLYFWDLNRIIAYEDRMRTYNCRHVRMDRFIEEQKDVVLKGSNWVDYVSPRVVSACRGVNHNTLVGLWMARRNRRHHRDNDPIEVQNMLGPMQEANFEFWETHFPSFTLYIYKRLASYRPVGNIFLYNTLEFRGSQYFPSSPGFYRVVSNATVFHDDPIGA